MTLARLLPLVVLVGVVGGVALTSAQDTSPLPEAPPYVLLPPSWPYPAFPTCSTPYGICRFPQDVAAGAPCSCVGANGVWAGGHITVNPLYPLAPIQPGPSPLPRPSPPRPDRR
jgi:hypothetical protein